MKQPNLQIFGDKKASTGAQDSISSLAVFLVPAEFYIKYIVLRRWEICKRKILTMKRKGTYLRASGSWNAFKASTSILWYDAANSHSWQPMQPQAMVEIPGQCLLDKSEFDLSFFFLLFLYFFFFSLLQPQDHLADLSQGIRELTTRDQEGICPAGCFGCGCQNCARSCHSWCVWKHTSTCLHSCWLRVLHRYERFCSLVGLLLLFKHLQPSCLIQLNLDYSGGRQFGHLALFLLA